MSGTIQDQPSHRSREPRGTMRGERRSGARQQASNRRACCRSTRRLLKRHRWRDWIRAYSCQWRETAVFRRRPRRRPTGHSRQARARSEGPDRIPRGATGGGSASTTGRIQCKDIPRPERQCMRRHPPGSHIPSSMISTTTRFPPLALLAGGDDGICHVTASTMSASSRLMTRAVTTNRMPVCHQAA